MSSTQHENIQQNRKFVLLNHLNVPHLSFTSLKALSESLYVEKTVYGPEYDITMCLYYRFYVDNLISIMEFFFFLKI